MLKARQILAISAIILIFSGWGGLAWAAGYTCKSDGSGCPSTAPSIEQCCCCGTPTNLTKPQSCPGSGSGVCFPQKVVIGMKTDPQTKIQSPITADVNCSDVICPFSSHTDIKAFIDAAVTYIFYISVILAPLMIIIGAFLFLTSAGSPKQSKLGSSIIQWTAIGFAIILFAKGISAIIKMILVG